MRPLPGAPGVTAAAALWLLLLLLLPRARADEHEHTVSGAPGRRGRPRPAPRLAAPRRARRGLESPAARWSPWPAEGAFRLGLAAQEPGSWEEAFPCAPGAGLGARVPGLFPRPDLDGAPAPGPGLPRPRPGQERGEGPGSPRRGVGVAGRPGWGRWELRSGCRELRRGGRWMR